MSTDNSDPRERRDEDKREEEGDNPTDRLRSYFQLRAIGPDGKRLEKLNVDEFAETLREWRRRKLFSRARMIGGRGLSDPTPPATPPATNWIPIGPSVVRRGQATGRPAVSGRVADIAVAPGGLIAYAATANGGVWRSDDGGDSWRSLMDEFDVDPTSLNTDSLACGAVAIDPAQPDRVYVGTGEGESAYAFGGIFGFVFSYAGVGMLRSDTGGAPWIQEPVATGSPSLNGHACFELAVDPTDREHVVVATTQGLYVREPDGVGGYHWAQRQAGYATSVRVARSGGTTVWFAALEGGTLLTATNTSTWTALGTGYPTAGVRRVSLATQPDNTGVVYAYSAQGVHRLDVAGGTWKSVSGSTGGSDYRMAIAVDPSDINRLFFGNVGFVRATVASSGGGPSVTYSMTKTPVGSDVHADLHRFVFRSDATNELWAASDGGIFQTTAAAGTAAFIPRNTGLQTMTCTYLSQHPTEAAVLFSGSQDNGTLRYTGEEVWFHSDDGDGGAVVVNWNDPYKVMHAYFNGAVSRATDGGAGPSSYSVITPPATGWLFYAPLVGTPPNPGTPSESEIVAFGADRTWFTSDFGTSWSSPDTTALNGTVSALVFASGTLLYAGTTSGRIYQYTRTGPTWSAGTLIGQVGAGASGLAQVVTDIAVDPADATGASFYVCLGGAGDWRRIWHYDGTSWDNRSGPSAGAGTSVLNVHFNALCVDPTNTSNVYAGGDIGIWRSTDGGSSWTTYADGLPDAGVSDLLLHPTRRLLRAATYGRGVFERAIDATSALGVELYVRDTDLDLGLWPTVDYLADPEDDTQLVRHWRGPNIKVDPPSSSGTYQLPTTIDFLQFVDELVDGSDGTATVDPATGTAVNRVYVEVHNRGVTPADGVQVMLLLTHASGGLPPLPSGLAGNVQSGTPINTADWKTVGFHTLNGLRVGFPQVAEFDLPSTMLPPPSSLGGNAHWCVLALLHSASDPFNTTESSVDALSVGERKAAHRNLHVIEFTGTLPSPGAPAPRAPMAMMIDFHGREALTDVIFDVRRMKGSLTALIAADDVHEKRDVEKMVVGGRWIGNGALDTIVHESAELLERYLQTGRFDRKETLAAKAALTSFAGAHAFRFETKRAGFVGLRDIVRRRHLGTPLKLLLVVEPPHDAAVGDQWDFDVIQVDARRRTIVGGSSYLCRVTLPRDDERAIQIDVDREIHGDAVRLLARATAKGRIVGDGKHESMSAVLFGTEGFARIETLVWNPERESFGLTLEGPKGRAIRRVTFVARAGEHEGRKTVSVRPAAERC